MLNRLYVILSAEQAGKSADDNAERTAQLYGYLERYFSGMYDAVVGHFKGTSENSFIVQCKDHREVGELFNQAQNFDQECIMVIDPKARGFLLYSNLKMESIGSVTASEWLPDGLQNYTHNPKSDIYYYTL